MRLWIGTWTGRIWNDFNQINIAHRTHRRVHTIDMRELNQLTKDEHHDRPSTPWNVDEAYGSNSYCGSHYIFFHKRKRILVVSTFLCKFFVRHLLEER